MRVRAWWQVGGSVRVRAGKENEEAGGESGGAMESVKGRQVQKRCQRCARGSVVRRGR